MSGEAAKIMRKIILFVLIVTIIATVNSSVLAQRVYTERNCQPGFQVPDELIPFVEAETKATAYTKADLNGDETLDYVVVLENINKPKLPADMKNRSTLIIIRDSDERLRLAARSERVVFCPDCAGGTVDPFEDIIVETGIISIINRGGTNTRWAETFDFKYSRRDKNWQLARVEKMKYESSDLSSYQTKTYTSPKDFGKISFEAFDPENFQGKGLPVEPPKKSLAGVKTRRVDIYLYRLDDENFPIMPILVPVKRRVDARAPLTGAIQALLAGATKREERINKNSFIKGVELDSVSIKNNQARIDLFYDEATGNRDDPMMELLFDQSIERTALQFPTVKRVLVCVNGIKNFYLYKDYQKKCPEKQAEEKR